MKRDEGGAMRDEFKNYSSFIPHPSALKSWRKGWDSNPRNPFEVHSISNAANSTALAPFLGMLPKIKFSNRKRILRNLKSALRKIQNPKSQIQNRYGGEGGIRTHGAR
jgi:hypothetical protein